MSPWSSSFLAVQFWARQFALAWDENETNKQNIYKAMWWVLKNDMTLAVARGQLEMAKTSYKVEERIGRGQQ